MLFVLPCFSHNTPTTETYTLSLHDALPISTPAGRWPTPSARAPRRAGTGRRRCGWRPSPTPAGSGARRCRSEEHTSELQSLRHLVCRLLLEKKKKKESKKQDNNITLKLTMD